MDGQHQVERHTFRTPVFWSHHRVQVDYDDSLLLVRASNNFVLVSILIHISYFQQLFFLILCFLRTYKFKAGLE